MVYETLRNQQVTPRARYNEMIGWKEGEKDTTSGNMPGRASDMFVSTRTPAHVLTSNMLSTFSFSALFHKTKKNKYIVTKQELRYRYLYLHITYYVFLKKNQNAPRPSEHPPVMGEKMSKR